MRSLSARATSASFTFVRSTKNRGGGDDDFDVRDGDRVIGRIVRAERSALVLGD
jgi:hypothetical protein